MSCSSCCCCGCPSLPSTRLAARFDRLKREGRAAFIAFVTGGDPDLETSASLIEGLPGAGVDVIEIGMPFSDPMADGPTIQVASQRALAQGINLVKVLELVRRFRVKDQETPIVLMGYFNPIFFYGVERFVADAKAAGVDGLIIPDLPPEEDSELCLPALAGGVNFIRLLTPTTDAQRLPVVLKNASGFLYYVSVAGITGTQKSDLSRVKEAVAAIKAKSDLPLAVGFGISSAEEVRATAALADGVIVGSAIVKKIASCLDNDNRANPGLVDAVLSYVRTLTEGCKNHG